jgi:hypothetical protein
MSLIGFIDGASYQPNNSLVHEHGLSAGSNGLTCKDSLLEVMREDAIKEQKTRKCSVLFSKKAMSFLDHILYIGHQSLIHAFDVHALMK